MTICSNKFSNCKASNIAIKTARRTQRTGGVINTAKSPFLKPRSNPRIQKLENTIDLQGLQASLSTQERGWGEQTTYTCIHG